MITIKSRMTVIANAIQSAVLFLLQQCGDSSSLPIHREKLGGDDSVRLQVTRPVTSDDLNV
ncbi:Uncharacterised protein [Mycobacteroides abscessus subsp. abscessus]|nr:Uncharacterised protein [Mycobacteroides abscessus subsp. abscessus]